MVITAPPSATPDTGSPAASAESSSRSLSVEIDGFDDLQQIGRGGQATVYRAHRLSDDMTVAIKVFDRSLPTQAGRAGGRGEQAAIRRFEREVHSLRRVSDHSAVVTLLGSGTTESGQNYIVLDHTGRGSLADVLPSAGHGGPVMAADEATVLGVRIAGALERAHRAGLVHCDIKPGNVLAFDGADGSTDWRLSDFGIATIDSNATENLQLTVVHAAPEVFAGEANTEASDVYALASVVHTAMTGRPPFEPEIGETTPAFMHRIATEAMHNPRDLGVADPIAEVLERALDKDPSRRHPSARVFGLALNQARAQLGLDRVAMAITDGDDDSVTHVVDLDALEMAAGPNDQDATKSRKGRARRGKTRRDRTKHVASGDGGVSGPSEPPTTSPRSPRRRSWVAVCCMLILAVGGIVATMRGGGIGILPDQAQELAADFVEIVEDDGPNNDGPDNDGNNNDGDGDGNNNNNNNNNNDGNNDGDGNNNDGDGDGDGNNNDGNNGNGGGDGGPGGGGPDGGGGNGPGGGGPGGGGGNGGGGGGA